MDLLLAPNPYKILNVAQEASLATIRSAHRKLVLACHPDRFQDEAVKVQKQEQFYEVQLAYEMLSDETNRQLYDARLKLVELRNQMMKEKGRSCMVSESTSRPRPSPTYEERRDLTRSRSFEEDVLNVNLQKYDDRYSPPASRRSISEEKRTREKIDQYISKWRSAKAAKKSTKHSQEKRKDRDTRKDGEAKVTSKSPDIEDLGSDSDTTERVYLKSTPKRGHDDMRRRDRDEPRRSSRRENSDHSVRLDKQSPNAEDCIKQTREAAPIDVETRRPSLAAKDYSTAEFEARPSHPSATPMPPIGSGRRSLNHRNPSETQRQHYRGRGKRRNEGYWTDYNSRDDTDPFNGRECLFSDGDGNLRTPAMANLDTGLKVTGGLVMSSQYAKELGRYQDISQDFVDPCLRSISGHMTPVAGILRGVLFRLKGTSVTFKRDFFICDAIDGLVDIMFGASFIRNQFKLLFERVKECFSTFATWFSTKKESTEEKAERERRERDQRIKANQREIEHLRKEQQILQAAQRQSQEGAGSRQ